jgi:hypothetical protein
MTVAPRCGVSNEIIGSGEKLMFLFLAFLVGSLIVAFLGRNCRFGFWGNFFASMLLSPLVGILLVLAAEPRAVPENRDTPGAKDCESRQP